MNLKHLSAVIWLRWRITANQMKKGGVLGTILAVVIVCSVIFLSLTAFVVSVVVGILTLDEATPAVILLVWDIIVAAFLMFWLIGLITELQRSELLSLHKFLHLPVSLTGTFLINYVSSLVTIGTILFVPGMIGLTLAHCIVQGPKMLVMFPLVVSFLLMVSAVTYQFRGWLATMMMNKRKRRTVITVVTGTFIMLCQVPNMLNIYWQRSGHKTDGAELTQSSTQLQNRLKREEITSEEFKELHEKVMSDWKQKRANEKAERNEVVFSTASTINSVLPIGWLPFGAMMATDHSVLPALLGTLGATLIGSLCLWRSYRTTMRYYTGNLSGKSKKRPRVTSDSPKESVKMPVRVFEMKIPFLSEQATAITLANFRMLNRAPEVKMIMLTPIILMVVLGSALFTGRENIIPLLARPAIGLSAVGITMFTMTNLIQNQFGFDRNGFRFYVLSCAPRRDILLGKNLSVAPFGLVLGAISVSAVQLVFPMGNSHFLANLIQLTITFMMFCMAGNIISMIAPMAVASGSMKPAKPKARTIMLQMVFAMMFPLALIPAGIPLGLDLALRYLEVIDLIPLYLILTFLEFLLVLYLYRVVLGWQSRLLCRREQRILETVTVQVE